MAPSRIYRRADNSRSALRDIRRAAPWSSDERTRGTWLLPRQPSQQWLALESDDAAETSRRHRGVVLGPTENCPLVDPQHVRDLASREEGRQGISGPLSVQRDPEKVPIGSVRRRRSSSAVAKANVMPQAFDGRRQILSPRRIWRFEAAHIRRDAGYGIWDEAKRSGVSQFDAESRSALGCARVPPVGSRDRIGTTS